MVERPNILLILSDDMGFSDLGCYGGEVRTPHLDALAAGGLRFTQFTNTARCCPSRASLLTGLHPHQADIGFMTRDDGVDGYLGDLASESVTLAEVLGAAGYRCGMSGKWHVTRHVDPEGPKHNWPLQRGFDQFYGILSGCGNYYCPGTLVRDNAFVDPEGDDYFMTDAFTDEAVRQWEGHFRENPGRPFFQYLAYTAPHWPLHAREEDIRKCRGRYDAGWDVLRGRRLERLAAEGVVPEGTVLTARDPGVPAWRDVADKEWEARRMEVYAAQIEGMDRGIGRVVDCLRAHDGLENTLIFFLSDNGGCAEELPDDAGFWRCKSAEEGIATMRTRSGSEVRFGNTPGVDPGGEDSYMSYGKGWANLSNAPFREYKHWVHEGGIATPLIVHWPAGVGARGELRHQPGQLMDIMATVVEVTRARMPAERGGQSVPPCEGASLLSVFRGGDLPGERTLCWEHEGNAAIRCGRWKLVRKYGLDWELFDLESDRSESRDLAKLHPDIVSGLSGAHADWAVRCGVRPWGEILERRGL